MSSTYDGLAFIAAVAAHHRGQLVHVHETADDDGSVLWGVCVHGRSLVAISPKPLVELIEAGGGIARVWPDVEPGYDSDDLEYLNQGGTMDIGPETEPLGLVEVDEDGNRLEDDLDPKKVVCKEDGCNELTNRFGSFAGYCPEHRKKRRAATRPNGGKQNAESRLAIQVNELQQELDDCRGMLRDLVFAEPGDELAMQLTAARYLLT